MGPAAIFRLARGLNFWIWTKLEDLSRMSACTDFYRKTFYAMNSHFLWTESQLELEVL